MKKMISALLLIFSVSAFSYEVLECSSEHSRFRRVEPNESNNYGRDENGQEMELPIIRGFITLDFDGETEVNISVYNRNDSLIFSDRILVSEFRDAEIDSDSISQKRGTVDGIEYKTLKRSVGNVKYHIKFTEFRGRSLGYDLMPYVKVFHPDLAKQDDTRNFFFKNPCGP